MKLKNTQILLELHSIEEAEHVKRQVLKSISAYRRRNNIQVSIGYFPEKKTKTCITNLDEWLSRKNIKFERVDHAYFENGMMLSTVEFDKDNLIYILLPENVFKSFGNKMPFVKFLANLKEEK